MNSTEKICFHIDALFGKGVSKVLPKGVEFTFSKKTGRIKSFGIKDKLLGTLEIRRRNSTYNLWCFCLFELQHLQRELYRSNGGRPSFCK